MSRPGVTDTIFDYFSFNSAADLLCIISSKLTPVKLNFHFKDSNIFNDFSNTSFLYTNSFALQDFL